MTNAIAQAAATISGNDVEATRLAERRALREQLGRRRMGEKRRGELVDELAALDQRVDRADEQHAARVADLQAELASVEARIVAAMADRKPVAASDEDKRRELLARIKEENEALAGVIATVNELKKPLRRELAQVGMAVAQAAAIESQLSNERLGNPGLLDQLFVARSAAAFAQARRQSAMANADKNAARLAEVERHPRRYESHVRGEYEKRARRWQLEIDEAQAAVNDANERIDAIRRQLIDE